jgi:hypothetical protein
VETVAGEVQGDVGLVAMEIQVDSMGRMVKIH